MSTKESLAIGVWVKLAPISVDLLLDQRFFLDDVFRAIGDVATEKLRAELERLGRDGFIAKLREIQPEIEQRPEFELDL